MKFEKYKKIFLIFLGYVILATIMVILLAIGRGTQMSPFVPGETLAIEIAVIYLISFILGPIIGIFFGFLFGPIFLFIQKKILGRKLIYGIQDRPTEKRFTKTLRALFPSLMALNFAMLLAGSPFIENIIAPTEESISYINPIVVIAMLMFTIIIAFALFSGVWFLLDSGLMYSNRDKDLESDQPIETRSVGGFFLVLLQGYAGISVAFGFYEFAISSLEEHTTPGDLIGSLFLMFPIPIFIMIASFPSIILLDFTRKQRITYMRKVAKIYGIKDYLESIWETKKIE